MYTLLTIGPLIETIYDLLDISHDNCELINYDGLRIHICLINDATWSIVNFDSRWQTQIEMKSKSCKAQGNKIRHNTRKTLNRC